MLRELLAKLLTTQVIKLSSDVDELLASANRRAMSRHDNIRDSVVCSNKIILDTIK